MYFSYFRTQFRYIASGSLKEELAQLKGFVELEETADEFGRVERRMPGSGITKTLLEDW